MNILIDTFPVPAYLSPLPLGTIRQDFSTSDLRVHLASSRWRGSWSVDQKMLNTKKHPCHLDLPWFFRDFLWFRHKISIPKLQKKKHISLRCCSLIRLSGLSLRLKEHAAAYVQVPGWEIAIKAKLLRHIYWNRFFNVPFLCCQCWTFRSQFQVDSPPTNDPRHLSLASLDSCGKFSKEDSK